VFFDLCTGLEAGITNPVQPFFFQRVWSLRMLLLQSGIRGGTRAQRNKALKYTLSIYEIFRGTFFLVYNTNSCRDFYYFGSAKMKSFSMRKFLLLFSVTLINSVFTFSQHNRAGENLSFRYYASPGFVNVSELNAAIGAEDSITGNAKYYFGLTNVFGYQINRNFFGGAGIGLLIYENTLLVPVYLEYKYSVYTKGLTPFLYADGGVIIDPSDFYDESKIFLNPGIGISRTLSPKLEINLSAGFMVQSRSSFSRVTYINFKLGIAYRKNAFRYFRPHRIYPE
jgi:hypothetical protein